MESKMKIYIDLKKFRTVKGENNDCGVTSIAIATGVGYSKAWQVLNELGRAKGEGTFNRTMHKAIKTMGFKSMELQFRTPITLARFIKLHNRGRYVVYTKDHAVAIVDGKLFDSSMTHGKTHLVGFMTVED
jgi:hypothetical protein